MINMGQLYCAVNQGLSVEVLGVFEKADIKSSQLFCQCQQDKATSL